MATPSKYDNITFTKTRYIFLWLLLFYLAFYSLYGISKEFLPFLPSFKDPLVNQILYSFSFVSLCLYLIRELRRSKLKPKYIIGNLRPFYRWLPLLGWAIIFLLFSVGATLISFHGLSLVAPEFYDSFAESISEQESQVSVLPIMNKCWQTINYVVVAPITEEFIFRGILLHRLATRLNLSSAIWISSIIFGMLHPNPIGISAVGIAWALLYIKTRTLVVPIIAHSMNNSIVVLGELALDWLTPDDASNAMNNDVIGNEWIAGLLFIAVSLPFVVRFIYRRFPRKDKSLPYFANAAKMITDY